MQHCLICVFQHGRKNRLRVPKWRGSVQHIFPPSWVLQPASPPRRDNFSSVEEHGLWTGHITSSLPLTCETMRICLTTNHVVICSISFFNITISATVSFCPTCIQVLLEEMDLFPKHPETLPCKRTDLESYRQQMWHTQQPRSPQQAVRPHLPQRRRSESPHGLHPWSAARCCRGRAPRWTARSLLRCGLPPSASRTDLLGSHLSHARSCGEWLRSQNRPVRPLIYPVRRLVFLWDEHWADPDLPQSSQRPFLLWMLVLQWKTCRPQRRPHPSEWVQTKGVAAQPLCGPVIPALLSPACFFEGSGRWGMSCMCQDYQLTSQNHASKAETCSQQPPKIKKPSRTVLMSPCRSYCEATDIDAF